MMAVWKLLIKRFYCDSDNYKEIDPYEEVLDEKNLRFETFYKSFSIEDLDLDISCKEEHEERGYCTGEAFGVKITNNEET